MISSDVVSDTPDMSTHGELFRFHSASLNRDTLNYVVFFVVYMPIFINSVCIPLPCINLYIQYGCLVRMIFLVISLVETFP